MPLRQVGAALRRLARSPGYSVSAVVIIALGVAASATVFSLVTNVFLKPLPVGDPDRLVRVFQSSYPDYVDYRDRNRVFSELAAHYSQAPLNLTTENASFDVVGAVVSANYFPLLGLQPQIGRFFLPAEDQAPGAGPVAVLGFRFWKRQFSGTPDVVGTAIKLNGTYFTVVGVAPKGFVGVSAGRTNDLWIPTSMLAVGYRWCENAFSRSCDILDLLGRLRKTESLAGARAEMSTLAAQLEAEYPGAERGRNALIEFARGLPSNIRGDDARLTRLLLALVACMLLIACANLAGLTLLRSQALGRDVNIRLSLGAPRRQIVFQLMAESFSLSAVGGTLGILLSWWMCEWFGNLYSRPNRVFEFGLDPIVVTCSVIVTALVGIAFGLFPAVRTSLRNPAEVLRTDSRTQAVSNSRARNGLVVVQVAVCLLLTAGATVLAQSIQHLQPGMNFEPDGIAIVRLRPRLLNYTTDKSYALYRRVMERLDALPFVESASFGRGWQDTAYASAHVALPEHGASPLDQQTRVAANEIAPRYFETLHIPLLAGREFNDRDNDSSPRVAVVNETLALQLLGRVHSLGETVLVDGTPHVIVGVARNAEFSSFDQPSVPFLYLPKWQADTNFTDARISVRVRGNVAAALPMIRQAIHEIDPYVPITEEGTLVNRLKQRFMPVYLAASVFGYASAFALVLCLVGLYTAVAFSVALRTKEIGIRIALGATPRRILCGVVGNGFLLALCGVAVGSVAAVGLSTGLASLLYGVSPYDTANLLTAAGLLIGASSCAALLPGLQASKIDPVVALRQE